MTIAVNLNANYVVSVEPTVTLNASYVVSVEPTVEPLTLNELKSRLRITACDFDSELTDLIKAGRKQVELESHRKLVTQTVKLNMDRFPAGDTIELRILPVASVTSVEYIDEDLATQTYASSRYTTDLTGEPARIVLLENESWEDTEAVQPKAVTVTFVAGNALASVPVEAKLAVVEWCRMHWGDCDGNDKKYKNLVSTLAWSGYWKAM